MEINEKILEELRVYCNNASDDELTAMSNGLTSAFCFLADLCNRQNEMFKLNSFPRKLKNIIFDFNYIITDEVIKRLREERKGS